MADFDSFPRPPEPAQQQAQPDPLPPSGRDGIGFGLLIGVGLHGVIGAPLIVLWSFISPDTSVVALVACGLTQLIYMIPAMLIARSKCGPSTLRGIALIAAITFLLNAGCFGLLALSGPLLH